MPSKILTGLMRLKSDQALQKQFSGNIGLLCHSASIDENYQHAAEIFIDLFGERFKKIYGPQHGFVTDVQDNMIETENFVHPYFKRPVYSLYSETRIPTDEMLEDIDHLFVDLQDVGTRIYTYIYTLTLLLEKCADKDIEVIVLDRPNPIGCDLIEGNILEPDFASFVGRHPIPVRHGLTIGEVARMHQKFWTSKTTHLKVLEMSGYKRNMFFTETALPYVNPSPNLPTIEGCLTFVGTVLLEGTSLSEGRGTTRPLEVIGHPKFEPWKWQKHFKQVFNQLNLTGFILRPVAFHPMFQKHKDKTCGGYFIQITDRNIFQPWRVTQVLIKEFKRLLGGDFEYKTDAYEYEFEKLAIDLINGTDKIRSWYENDTSIDLEFLDRIEQKNMDQYLEKRSQILIYK
ncbi:MAG: hypothetical protein CME65_14225 [Halobacteriovoraceae bacterium]|nr:hypothetical protein [Halobacteriovoraceae bacterium]|tara:strand:+ start:3813 stop:5015 length:1203 start_codon:yes stop_codon:yes gene_type:complete